MIDRRRFVVASMSGTFAWGLNAAFPAYAGEERIRLGITAQRGIKLTENRWQELAVYLGRSLHRAVEIVPVEITRAYGVAADKAVDLFLANPNQTLMLKYKQNARLLASVVGKHGPNFSGVIVARKESGIARVEDLKAKLIAALGRQSAGGYLFQAHHTARKGMRARQDYGVQFSVNQDEAIENLQNGKVSAAFVRSGILETMVEEGRIRMDDFVVIDERKDAGFPLRHTTALYPEHFMIALPHLDNAIADAAKKAVLRLTAGEAALQSAGIKGFIEPLSTAALENIMRELKAPPFEKTGTV